jgi:hypothetical protein
LIFDAADRHAVIAHFGAKHSNVTPDDVAKLRRL